MATNVSIILSSSIVKNEDKLRLVKTYISKEMLSFFWKNYNEERLEMYDEYIQDSLEIVEYTTNQLIEMALSNLFFSINGIVMNVAIDSNITIPNTTTKIIEIINLITYGNLEIKGYNIVVDTFNYVKSISLPF